MEKRKWFKMGCRFIYLVRHGEIDKESDKRTYIGQIDLDLNRQGIKQAKNLGDKLKDIRFERIYSSSLKRAIKTAKIICAHHNVELEKIDEFREIKLGEWEGKSFDDIKKYYPNEFKERGENIIHYCVPGGENFYQCNQRAMKKFHRILSKVDGNILIVAHAGVNRLILCNVLGISLDKIFQIPQDYGCFNTIIDNRGKLKVKNINKNPQNT